MSKILLLLLGVTVSYALFSQNRKPEQSLSIGIGLSFPLGDFASTEFNDDGAGYAGIGQALNINYFLPFSKSFGLIVSGSGQRNPVKTKKLEESFNNAIFSQPYFVYGPGSISLTPLIKYENWNFEKNTWLSANVMAGIQMSTEPNKDNISFYSRVQFGALYISMPEFKGESNTNDTLIVTFTQTSSHGIGFAYGFSAGMNYSLNKKTFLFANAGWTGTSKIKLEDINTTLVIFRNPGPIGNMSVSSSSVHVDGKQDFQSLNITFGIGLRL